MPMPAPGRSAGEVPQDIYPWSIAALTVAMAHLGADMINPSRGCYRDFGAAVLALAARGRRPLKIAYLLHGATLSEDGT